MVTFLMLLSPIAIMAYAGMADSLIRMIINFGGVGITVLFTQIVMHVWYVDKGRFKNLDNFLNRIATSVTVNKWKALWIAWLLGTILITPYLSLFFCLFFIGIFLLCIVVGIYTFSLLNKKLRVKLISRKAIYLMLHGVIQQSVAYVLYALLCRTPVLRSWLYVRDSEYEYTGFAFYPDLDAFSYMVESYIIITIIFSFPNLLFTLIWGCKTLHRKHIQKKQKYGEQRRNHVKRLG